MISDKFFLLRIQKYLILLIPLALLTGPFIPDAIISLCSVFFIFSAIKEKNYKFFLNKLFIIFFSFCIYLVFLSIFIAENTLLSFESSLFYFRFGFFVLSVVYVLQNDEEFENLFLKVLFFSILLLISDAYLQYFTSYNSIAFVLKILNLNDLIDVYGYSYSGIYPDNRLSSFLGKEKILGSYVTRILPFVILFIYKFYNKNNYFLSAVLMFTFISCSVLVLLSGERSAFFSLILYFIIFLKIINFNYKIKITAIALVSLSLILISILHQETLDRMYSKTLYQYSKLEFKIPAFTPQHQVIYISAFSMFKDNPVFGIAPKMFRQICKKDKYQFTIESDSSVNGCQTHPHNTYLQLLSETGIIGVIPIFFLFIYSFYSIFFRTFWFKLNSHNSTYFILMTSVLVNLWPLIPTGNFFNNWLSVLYYLPLGFIIHSQIKNKI